MPDPNPQDDQPRKRRTVDEAYQEGYEAGFAEGRKPQRPSLMEACKGFARLRWDMDDPELLREFVRIADEYGEKPLSVADQHLCLAEARRERVRAEAPEKAIRSLVRQGGRREHVETGDIVVR